MIMSKIAIYRSKKKNVKHICKHAPFSVLTQEKVAWLVQEYQNHTKVKALAKEVSMAESTVYWHIRNFKP